MGTPLSQDSSLESKMFYIEVSFVYGKAQLQTFYGPFDTPEERDAYVELLQKREQECIRDSFVAEAAGNIPPQDAAMVRAITNPNHAKYLSHDGPLPPGDWSP